MEKQSLTDTDVFPVPPPREWVSETISSRVEVDLGGLSDPGKVRPVNEDHFFVARFDRTLRPLLTNLPPEEYPASSGETGYGMLVADGMGGHLAGEVASRSTINVLLDLVLRTPDWIMLLDDQGVMEAFRRMDQRFQQIQRALAEQARANPDLAGMGTTLTLAWSLGSDLLIAHVGDSRAYLFRAGQLRQLTRDQTVVQEMVDSGALSPEEAARHRLRNVLTGALSADERKAPVKFGRFHLADGDQVLLCSDGLTTMVAEETMADVLRKAGSAADACRILVDRALEAGGKDNVTVVLARYRIPVEAVRNESQ